MSRGDKLVESKSFRTVIKAAFVCCIAMFLLIIFMIGNFLFKVYILDYRFDDGELMPPIESKLILPEDIPSFVEVSDLKKVDWDKKAVTFDDNIIGNVNKSGVIGTDMPSININQKWMWHLWGIENPEATILTVVGLHRETGTVHQILTTGWTIDLAGENNGADAHAPSSVNIPKAGEWAVLLYTDGKLFDEIVYGIEE